MAYELRWTLPFRAALKQISSYFQDADGRLTALESGGGGGGIPEAPNDGSLYARQSLGWTSFTPGLSDAPSDGNEYVRLNGAWSIATGGGGATSWGSITGTLSNQTDLQTALDAKLDVNGIGDQLTGVDAVTLGGLSASTGNTGSTHVTRNVDGDIAVEDITAENVTANGLLGFVGFGGNLTGISVAWGDVTGKPSTFPPSAHTHTLSDVTDSGTAAALDVPAAGNAAAGEVVKGDDTRLTDARTPTAHTHVIADVTGLQTELNNKLGVLDTAADSSLLGGLSSDVSATGNTIARRNADGDLAAVDVTGETFQSTGGLGFVGVGTNITGILAGNVSGLSTVATTGSYADLSDEPWNATTGRVVPSTATDKVVVGVNADIAGRLAVRSTVSGGEIVLGLQDSGGRPLNCTAPDSANATDPFVWFTNNAVSWEVDSTELFRLGDTAHAFFPHLATGGSDEMLTVSSTGQVGSQAIPGGGGGGTTITFFQVQDDGTTGQTTTGSYADITGIWTTPTLTDADFSWNGTTGILTVNTAGTLELDIKVMTHQSTGNNRTQLDIRLMKNGSTELVRDSNYSQRNGTQDTGSAYITGFKDSAAINDTYKIQVKDVGTAVNVGTGLAAGGTYISAKLYT